MVVFLKEMLNNCLGYEEVEFLINLRILSKVIMFFVIIKNFFKFKFLEERFKVIGNEIEFVEEICVDKGCYEGECRVYFIEDEIINSLCLLNLSIFNE